jgi:hypothetical protein
MHLKSYICKTSIETWYTKLQFINQNLLESKTWTSSRRSFKWTSSRRNFKNDVLKDSLLTSIGNLETGWFAGLRLTAKPVCGQSSFNSINLPSPPKGDVQDFEQTNIENP